MARPIVITSFAPRLRRPPFSDQIPGEDFQEMAVASWQACGFRVVGINYPHEVAELQKRFPTVDFIAARHDQRPTFGRPLVGLQDVQNAVRVLRAPKFFLTNSDIVFGFDEALAADIVAAADDHLVYANRTEVLAPSSPFGTTYNYGFDFFGGPSAGLLELDLSGFALGAPWWDFWFPAGFVLEGYPLLACDAALFRHVSHDQRWSKELWEMGFRNVLAKLQDAGKAADAGASGFWRHFLVHHLQHFRPPQQGGGGGAEWIGYFGTSLGVAMCSFIRNNTRGVLSLIHSMDLPPAAAAAVAEQA